jgi:hypothetical protein
LGDVLADQQKFRKLFLSLNQIPHFTATKQATNMMAMMRSFHGTGHFRKEAEQGIDSKLSSVTHDGIFGDYYFETGTTLHANKHPPHIFIFRV